MLASGRVFWKNVESVPKVFTSVRHCSAVKQSEVGVAIPKRIERGPTDILKALSSTIQLDPTAFAYKYPDDPYLYPFSNTEKRVFALSMESGRKSARWIVENNPGFFKNQLSDPPIEAFLPKTVPDAKIEVTEETLVEAVERRNVGDAMAVYELLQRKGTVIANDIKQSLLELVCFYNAEEKPNEEELEYKWFGNVEQNSIDVDVWKEQSFAEMLFESMDQNCPLANSALIQGMIKYNHVQKALDIFNRARSRNVRCSVGVYNGLLSQASNTSAEIPDGVRFIDFGLLVCMWLWPYLEDKLLQTFHQNAFLTGMNYSAPSLQLQDLLKEMAALKITPNLGTLNAALKSLTHLQRLRRTDDYVMKLLMEFAHLGISPSLGTYHYLFRIFGFSRRAAERNKDLFFKLLGIVQSTKHQVLHPADLLFFPQVMNLFSAIIKDVELVNRLNDILFQDDNIKFLDSSFSESLYFRNYFITIFKSEPIDNAMEKYRELVPTIYSPEYEVVSVILSSVITNGSTEYLVELWGDLKRFKMNKFMKVLCKIIPLAKVFTEEVALEVIHEAALNALEYYEENGLERASQDTVSHLLMAFLNTGDNEKALEVFAKVKDFKGGNALLNSEAVMELFRCALAQKTVPIILECLRYASEEFHLETCTMAEMAMPLLGESDQLWAGQLITKTRETEEEQKKPSPE